MIRRCHKAYAVLFIVVVSIAVYWVFLRMIYSSLDVQRNDILNKKLFDFPMLENCCSYWPITHLLLFAILGFAFPTCWLELLLLGVLWEVFESVLAYLAGKQRQYVVSNNDNIEYSKSWWSGSMKDIIMNIIGFALGWSIRKIVSRTKE